MFNVETLQIFGTGILETCYMVFFSGLFAYVVGLPLGVLLIVTDRRGLYPIRWFNGVLNILVNVFRSIPFLILMVWIMPFTRLVVGTSVGNDATIVPLVVSGAPFIARLVEQSLQEVDGGVVEAAQSMGASNWNIIRKVLLPEAKVSLVVGAAIGITTIVGYSAMAGFVGGGGLGAIATNYGFYKYRSDIMLITVVLLVIMVQVLQEIGMRLAKRIDRRNAG